MTGGGLLKVSVEEGMFEFRPSKFPRQVGKVFEHKVHWLRARALRQAHDAGWRNSKPCAGLQHLSEHRGSRPVSRFSGPCGGGTALDQE